MNTKKKDQQYALSTVVDMYIQHIQIHILQIMNPNCDRDLEFSLIVINKSIE